MSYLIWLQHFCNLDVAFLSNFCIKGGDSASQDEPEESKPAPKKEEPKPSKSEKKEEKEDSLTENQKMVGMSL